MDRKKWQVSTACPSNTNSLFRKNAVLSTRHIHGWVSGIMPAKVTEDYDNMMIRMMHCEQNVGLIRFHLLLLHGDMKDGRAHCRTSSWISPSKCRKVNFTIILCWSVGGCQCKWERKTRVRTHRDWSEYWSAYIWSYFIRTITPMLRIHLLNH
jgi:hypothetical protein